MKKGIIFLAIVAATLLGGCQSGQQSDAQDTTAAPIPTPAVTQVAPATEKTTEKLLSELKPITEATAKATALADAGLKEADVTFTKCKQDLHDGFQVYEIEFVSGNTEYDYTIDLFTGSIMEKEQENDND